MQFHLADKVPTTTPAAAHRAFTIIEIVVVAVVATVVSSVAIGLTVRSANTIADQQVRMSVLDFVQRQRNAHVNRAVEEEVLVLCTANGAGGCGGAAGNTLVAHLMPRPITMPPPAGTEIARATFSGNSFTLVPGPSLNIDAFARSTNDLGVPANGDIVMNLRSTVENILVRADGVTVASFDAQSALSATPHVNDMGSRATPNPTPQSQPVSEPRGRKVFLE